MDEVCEKLKAGSTAKGSIRNHLNEAIKGMVDGEETPARTAAKNWLEESYEALEVRNVTFHSTTTGYCNEKDGAFVLGEIQLINKKLMKDGSLQKTLTPLSASGLLARRDTLAHAYKGWRHVDVELAVED